jgi:uncharacterized membrane protein YciS (DUF1049 family)
LVLVFGVAVMLASAGVGGWVCWVNRDATVQVELAGYVWTGRLYGVFLAGAVLAGWFIFGAACIQLRIRERRERRAARLAESRLAEPLDADAERPARARRSAKQRSRSLRPAGFPR